MTDRTGQQDGRAGGDRQRPAASWLGRELVADVGAVAHGGHCVARVDGRVVFVRHCLPGERVTIRITEDGGGSFCRGDAVEVLEASPHRVPAPCAVAGPGGCGGCDFQHVDIGQQRRLKAAVVAEQLQRLAGLEWPVTVLPLAGTEHSGLGWRRRVRFAVDARGGLGLRAHRSHEVIELDGCPLGAPGVAEAPARAGDWAGAAEVEVAVDDDATVATVTYTEQSRPHQRHASGRGRGNPRRASRPRLRAALSDGPAELHYRAGGHDFTVSAGGFWQTHPAAAEAYLQRVLSATAPRAGERALDLYAGAGLFTAGLAQAVGEHGRVLSVEADLDAVEHARRNLARLPAASPRQGSVTATAIQAMVAELGGVDVVVLDPPRTGAGREVMSALTESGARVICYVACDPAALARDVRTSLELGWELRDLAAFDAFPMTHHVECIATLQPAPQCA